MENNIVGRVTIDGTTTGIPDLVVAIYDLDPTAKQSLYSMLGSWARRDALVESGDDPVEDSLTQEWQRFWLNVSGDRIGSVLTDARGRFELRYEDAEFKVRNTEKRPDLVMFVTGPERGFVSHPLRTLLHYVAVPRVNAGRQEGFLIAIERKHLQAAGIALEEGRAVDADAYVATQRELIAQTKRLNNGLQTLHREEIALGSGRRARARSFWSGMSGRLLQPSTAAPKLYASYGDAFPALQNTAIINGLEWIRNAPWRLGIRIWLNDQDLEDPSIDKNRLDAGEAVEVSVCDLLAKKGLGTELVRIRGLMDALKARRAQRSLAPRPSDGTGVEHPGGDGAGSGAESFEDTQAFVTKRVLGQIAELPELKIAKTRSTVDELQKIKETIDKLELSGGPANVTAFHDFSTLQIAFEDVWTAAFDVGLRDKVLDLYRQTVVLHEDYGLEVPPMEEIADANAMREYIAQLRNETSTIAVVPIPSDVQQCFPRLDLLTWNRLSEAGKSVLQSATLRHLRPYEFNDINPNIELWSTREFLDDEYQKVIKYHMSGPLARVEQLIVEVAERMNQPYAFKYFAPGGVNYGLMITYRQEWAPETYQVGRLVSTMPLAPGEERKLKVTRKINKTRAEKAIEKAMSESSAERQFTSRTELEVMSKVATTTNFRLNASGSLNFGIGQITASSEFSHNQQQEATQQKKQFLEAIQKAAERVRQESEIQIETNEQFEEGVESDTVLKNPNNELTVTYLLYELERRYRVSSRPHRLTPVVMVALDMPAPHEITEAWILEHAWILRRVLLDDAFFEAIEYVEGGLGVDDLDVQAKKANWDVQRQGLSQLESSLERLVEIRNTHQDTIVRLLHEEKLEKTAEKNDAERAAAAIFSGGISELFGGGASDRDELIKARREAAEKAMEFVAARIEALSERVSISRKAVTEAVNAYSAAMARKIRKDTATRQLKLHIRQNIMHYMHAIWDYRHQDQQFFELNDMQVPFLESATRRCRLRRATAEESSSGVPGIRRDGALYIATCEPPQPPPAGAALPKRRLGAIADLNRLLGYKGNYAIYPLKACSHLTDFMSQEFVDDYFGLRDPSTDLGYNGEELLAYAKEILDDTSVALSDSERESLIRAVTEQLTNPASGTETVILPTGQLYMEALKGEQTLLEDFKLAHRGMDMLKVQEEVRAERLENLRRAARIVAEIPNLDDPDVEKMVVVHGGRDLHLPIDVDH